MVPHTGGQRPEVDRRCRDPLHAARRVAGRHPLRRAGSGPARAIFEGWNLHPALQPIPREWRSSGCGTNTFAGLSGNNINISGFVFGNTGTTVVYIAVGTMYCTNSFSTPSNDRLIIGRNAGAPGTVFLTNGTVNSGNLVLANNATATPSQLVISGAGSYWSNNNTVAIGNAGNASLNSLVISNSGSMTVLNTLSAGAQSNSHSNSLLVDTSGQLFTRGGNATFGAGGGSVGNKATVQGGGLWDNGNRAITLGAGGGSGNTLIVGTNGTDRKSTRLN